MHTALLTTWTGTDILHKATNQPDLMVHVNAKVHETDTLNHRQPLHENQDYLVEYNQVLLSITDSVVLLTHLY